MGLTEDESLGSYENLIKGQLFLYKRETTPMATTTTSTAPPRPSSTSDTSAEYGAEENVKISPWDINLDGRGNYYYSLNVFQKKFNRTAVVRKPPIDQVKPIHNVKVTSSPNDLVPILTISATQHVTPSIGTRTFIPALVSLVVLLSLAMILIASCKVVASHCGRKKRNGAERKVEGGCKLSTLLPSAPPADEPSEMNMHLYVPETPSDDICAPPPDYETLFGSAARGDYFTNGKLVTEIEGRYPSKANSKMRENSMPLQPLLDSAQPVNGCRNCRQCQMPQSTQL